jgi:hypothetical protein
MNAQRTLGIINLAGQSHPIASKNHLAGTTYLDALHNLIRYHGSPTVLIEDKYGKLKEAIFIIFGYLRTVTHYNDLCQICILISSIFCKKVVNDAHVPFFNPILPNLKPNTPLTFVMPLDMTEQQC